MEIFNKDKLHSCKIDIICCLVQFFVFEDFEMTVYRIKQSKETTLYVTERYTSLHDNVGTIYIPYHWLPYNILQKMVLIFEKASFFLIKVQEQSLLLVLQVLL